MEEQRKYQTHVITCLIILLILVVAAIFSNNASTGQTMHDSNWGQEEFDTVANSGEACNRIEPIYSFHTNYPEDQQTGINIPAAI